MQTPRIGAMTERTSDIHDSVPAGCVCELQCTAAGFAQLKIRLKPGVTHLGRNKECNIMDVRVSRNAATAHWDASVGELDIDDHKYEDGDVFSLAGVLPFRVSIYRGNSSCAACQTDSSELTQLPPYHHYPDVWHGEKYTGKPFSLHTCLIDVNPQSVFWQNQTFRAVYDAFPKSRYHFLIVPTRRFHATPLALNVEALLVVESMMKIAQQIVRNMSLANPQLLFRMGFHAIPSIPQLHLHVISGDFDSPCMKVKKHWNSFTTDFLIHPLTLLRGTAESKEYYEKREKQPPECFRCRQVFRSFKDVYAHYATCRHDVESKDVEPQQPN
jgi:aprataxin